MDHPLLRSLFDEIENRPQSVSELNSDIRSVLEQRFASVWVEGEITNFVAASSGHWYFSLTDGGAFLKAACFKGSNYRIRFRPFDGLQVRVRGRITTYEKRGEYQLMVESLEPVGEGALTVAFEQIKAKLLKEGLFDEEAKRAIPRYPRRVGVVTSPTGAAIHDILTVLDRRARSVHVVVIPTLVQGELAGEQIARAIALANEYCDGCLEGETIDVLIVGRGGGSAEDLWAFNEEQVARAIRASKIPVISAVGHEVDFTIADMAADLRAPTPSAAAEIVASAEEEILEGLRRSTEDLRNAISYRMLSTRSYVERLSMSPAFTELPGRVRELGLQLDSLEVGAQFALSTTVREYSARLSETTSCLAPLRLSAKVGENKRSLMLLDQRARSAAAAGIETMGRKLDTSMVRLDALSPLAVLTRGYSITQKRSGEIVRKVHQTSVGELVDIRLAEGRIEAEVRTMEGS